MQINVTQSSMPLFYKYLEEIQDLWENNWLVNKDSKHQEIKKSLSNYLEVSNTTSFVNVHKELENVIATIDLTAEVITTPFTFTSTTIAILRNGLKPAYCDIKPDDYSINVVNYENLSLKKHKNAVLAENDNGFNLQTTNSHQVILWFQHFHIVLIDNPVKPFCWRSKQKTERVSA